jgi:tetratricopeptide (TPR) repeat protein
VEARKHPIRRYLSVVTSNATPGHPSDDGDDPTGSLLSPSAAESGDGEAAPLSGVESAATDDIVREGMALQNAGSLDEADAVFRKLIASTNPVVSSLGWRHVATVYRLKSSWADAVAAAQQAAAIAERIGLRELYAEALNAEAIVYQEQGDLDRAVPLLERMLTITADPKGMGIALSNLGQIAARRGDFETARHHFLQSHSWLQRAGHTQGVATVLNNFGRAALDHANPRVAQAMLEDALGAVRRIGDQEMEAVVTRNLAEAALGLGETDKAAQLLDAAEARFVADGNRLREVECIALRGDLAERLGDGAGAIAHLERAHALAVEIDAVQEVPKLAARLERLRGTAKA